LTVARRVEKAAGVLLGSFADVVVADVHRSVEFYRTLLGLDVITDHGWYAELGNGDRTLIAFVERGHETIPSVASTPPRGVLLSFEVDDVAPVYEAAVRMACEILIDLAAELGQHHFMISDPDGTVVDVIQRIPLTTNDMRRLVRYRRAGEKAS
jgi:catechol 2,3-dioxygenase-like lactoylglutathione lyase family enzyme